MVIDIVMPKMGESITEGTIIEWRKKIGDIVEMDEILLEIGTDKVDSEIPSPTAGTIVEILAKPNDIMEVGTVIAKVETDSDAALVQKSTQSLVSEQKTEELVEDKIVEVPKAISPKTKPQSGEKKFFTPVVNKIAIENNIEIDELMTILGTGKGGRVTKVDVLNYLKSRLTVPSAKQSDMAQPLAVPPAFSRLDETVEMDNMRKLIAEHMRNSLDTSAHVYVMTEVDMSAIVNYVNKQEDTFYQREGYKLTYTPFIIRACVKALNSQPEMNASLEDSSIVYHKNVNMGMAVAVNKGLMVPVLEKCEELNFLGLCRKVRDLALRTRNKQLNPDELQGSTFSISNFGVFNVTMGTPIINQPNVGILGVGVIKKRPVVIETKEGDTIGIKSMMVLSLGFDHRLIDGAGGSQFVDTVRENLENMNLETLL
ncbi:Dihydrolipoamide acyltransferase component of branched-chain alpha-keto acid dehydrogenase complex [hydrothermal vent metagenome]|uniref:Dihydrolipoamide acyltransferase component of branched-chain alpha-keto acid dehydrogenase complex n=2 Tax=ecological metagenomes TaxID=410657 RepID=A0A160VEP9_9ZZZZ|tara:strand:- start:3469 stop:4749 length:1281 start_codon:yes stop_codon:yes gene_type:complete